MSRGKFTGISKGPTARPTILAPMGWDRASAILRTMLLICSMGDKKSIMIVGDKSRIAIEAEPTSFVEKWILGHFRFWIDGKEVGDWDDTADLKGCWGWLRDFQNKPVDRFDASLVGLASDGIFRLLYDAVMAPGGIANPEKQPVPYAASRFHLGHLGMSSFEQFDLLLVKDEGGRERLLWRKADSSLIHEFTFEPNEMEVVAGQFCDQFEKLYISN